MNADGPRERERHLRSVNAASDSVSEPQSDRKSMPDLLVPAGECACCKAYVEQRTAIALIPGNSGPGWTVYGCVPCAKRTASFATASDSLREHVERLIEAGL